MRRNSKLVHEVSYKFITSRISILISKMKFEIVSSELIKPYSCTPPSFQYYRISLMDELCPTMNTPIILYYPSDAASDSRRCTHLKQSLSKALTTFYPLAGRYMKERLMVDCSDQGAYFVEAMVDVQLDDFIAKAKNSKVDLLNSLLPSPVGAADEITDPLLAVQVSGFACGGYAIAVMISHRVADMSTISTFIKEWCIHAKLLLEGVEENQLSTKSASWNSALFFPAERMSAIPLGLSRAKENVEDHKILTKLFLFEASAITRIREKAKLDSLDDKLPTRVQSVFGLIGKAIIDLHVADSANPREFLIVQALNMRERLQPPLPKDHCGNVFLICSSKSVSGDKGVELHILVEQLSSSVRRALESCKMLLSIRDEGQMMIAQAFNNWTNTISEPGIFIAGVFSDWSKFPFYEADYGWGPPIWVSTANLPIRNSTILMSDKTGQGIEAWVHLNVDDMAKFEKDSNIMEFTS